jgi:hypothetical protein
VEAVKIPQIFPQQIGKKISLQNRTLLGFPIIALETSRERAYQLPWPQRFLTA